MAEGISVTGNKKLKTLQKKINRRKMNWLDYWDNFGA